MSRPVAQEFEEALQEFLDSWWPRIAEADLADETLVEDLDPEDAAEFAAGTLLAGWVLLVGARPMPNDSATSRPATITRRYTPRLQDPLWTGGLIRDQDYL